MVLCYCSGQWMIVSLESLLSNDYGGELCGCKVSEPLFPGLMAECFISSEPEAELFEGESFKLPPQTLQGSEATLQQHNH